jgi:hypothetical protein
MKMITHSLPLYCASGSTSVQFGSNENVIITDSLPLYCLSNVYHTAFAILPGQLYCPLLHIIFKANRCKLTRIAI